MRFISQPLHTGETVVTSRSPPADWQRKVRKGSELMSPIREGVRRSEWAVEAIGAIGETTSVRGEIEDGHQPDVCLWPHSSLLRDGVRKCGVRGLSLVLDERGWRRLGGL